MNKLYEIKKGSRIYALEPGGDINGVVIFDHLDGMYSYCYVEGSSDKVVHLSAITPLEAYEDGYRISSDPEATRDFPMNPTKCTTCGQAPGFCSEHRRPVVSESVDSLCAACESEAHGRLIAFIKEAESNAVQEYIDSMGGVL